MVTVEEYLIVADSPEEARDLVDVGIGVCATSGPDAIEAAMERLQYVIKEVENPAPEYVQEIATRQQI